MIIIFQRTCQRQSQSVFGGSDVLIAVLGLSLPRSAIGACRSGPSLPTGSDEADRVSHARTSMAPPPADNEEDGKGQGWLPSLADTGTAVVGKAAEKDEGSGKQACRFCDVCKKAYSKPKSVTCSMCGAAPGEFWEQHPGAAFGGALWALLRPGEGSFFKYFENIRLIIKIFETIPNKIHMFQDQHNQVFQITSI